MSAPRSSHVALIAHLARRLRANRANVLTALDASRGGVHVPVSCELAMQLGVEVPSDASACAETLARAIVERGAHVLLTLPKAETWDGAVVDELARRMSGPTSSSLFVLVTDDPAAAIEASMADQGANETETYVLDPALGEADKLRWLSGVAEEVWTNFSSADLESLDTWWSFVRRLSPKAESTLHGLSDRARRWLGCLVLAGRSLPLSVIAANDAIDELVASGAVVRNESLVTVLPWVSKVQGELDLQDLQVEAAHLLAGPGTTPDPWAYARAAELLVGAGRIDDADVAMDKALRAASDPKAAREIGRTWLDALETVRGEAGLALRVRAAERALAIGEAREAQRWCESAAAIDAAEPTVSLLMGRALAALGDIVAARISLNKALSLTQDAELRAKTFAELAEVDYLAGQLADATACAERAMASTKSAHTKLAVRNTIGKVLLAEGRWDEADASFAEDALDASAAGERSSELRARVNRGIALLSKGALDDARAILELVREDGERWGIDQAVAHAHLNLGVIAFSQRDYGGALAHWEATVRYPHSVLGPRLALTSITNLADVRLFLGLIAHAEHGVAFGRRLLSSGVATKSIPTLSANFKRVAAQIALARGNSELARREIEAALIDAEVSRDFQTIEVIRAVSVRIALEEGDVRGAEAMLAHASKTVKSARAKAEFAILAAHHLRAVGKPAFDAARDACALVHEAKEVDLLAEIYLLLSTISRDQGNVLDAQAQIGRATALRDQIAATLPPDVRAAYLAKADVVAISRLSTSLADCELKSEDEIAPLSRMPVSNDTGMARELVGDDPSIRALNTAIRKVARSNATVLVRGESGTGKELVAEALHRASDRATGPLVSVNCAALVETLLLSELFGHEKGAFTGASARRRGRFELAEGGTLFLDEIGDISPRTQVALLRVLQEKTFERVGGTQSIRANVRIICATHRDLRAMVERGEFREDLYYRLRGITLEVPALRARIGDLPKIAEHLLARIAAERDESPKTLARDAVDLLSRHRWPGNVRELENVLRAVSLFAEGSEIRMGDLIDNVDDLRELAQSGPASQPPPSLSIRGSLLPPPPASLSGEVFGDDDVSGVLPEEESGVTSAAYSCVRQGTVSLSDMKRQIERDCIARALSETQGNITRAASLLGMKRPRLSQLVKQYGLSAYSSEGSS